MKSNNKDVLVKIENISKKFSLSLKRSLIYGMQDVGREMLGMPKKESLRKTEFWALDDISFEVKKGESVGLIGPNGAGKSTLLKMLNGLIKPDKGRITMKGRIGALIELRTGFNPILTGRENVYINASVLGFKKKEVDEKFDEIVAFSEIGRFIDMPVQNYSSGMKVRLGFAVAAAMEPDVLLIDEVLSVGDIRFRLKCFDHLEKLRWKGVAMIIVTHNLNHLSRICDRTVVFEKGKKYFDGDLPQGIICYDRLMSLMDLQKDSPFVRVNRKFSISVEVKNRNKDITNSFRTGEDILLELTIIAKKAIDLVRIECWIDSPNTGVLGKFSSHFSGPEASLEKGKNRFLLVLPEMSLLTGSYLIGFRLFDQKTNDILFSKRGLAIIEITTINESHLFGAKGVFQFKNKWGKI